MVRDSLRIYRTIKQREYVSRNRKFVNRQQTKRRNRIRNTSQYKASVLLNTMKQTSKRKGFKAPEFTREEIIDIITNGKCEVSGIPFHFNKSKYSRHPFSSSPDRIDNSKGYTKNNKQWVVCIYNVMKSEYPQRIVKQFLKMYYKYNNDK